MTARAIFDLLANHPFAKLTVRLPELGKPFAYDWFDMSRENFCNILWHRFHDKLDEETGVLVQNKCGSLDSPTNLLFVEAEPHSQK
jgi:hypothetical protein